MTVEEQVSHLANLAFLLDHYEKFGSVRNRWVVAEFESINNELIEALKEKHDASRQSEREQPFRSESGTDFSSRLSGSGSTDGESRSDAADVSRERI